MSAIIWRLVLVGVLTAATQLLPNAFAQTSKTLELSGDETSSSISTESSLVQRAEDAFARKDYEDATRFYKEYLDNNPDDDDQRIQLARALVAAGKRGEAGEVIAQVLNRTPDSTDALLIRGNLRLWEKSFGLARADFETVIKVAPEYCDAYVSLAKSYLWEGNRDMARTTLTSAPGTCKEGEEFKATLSQIEDAERDRQARPASDKQVERKLEPAETSAPTEDFDRMIIDARELIKAGNNRAAENTINYILSRKPDYADGLLLKGLLSLGRQNPAEAEYWFTRTLAVAPEYCEAYYGLSNVQIQEKNYDQARSILSARPECLCSAEGIAQQGRVENADGNYAEAKRLFQRAHTMDPGNQDICEALHSVELYTNTTTVHVESFRQTGTQWSFNYTFTIRPCKEVMWSAVLEHFHRFGQSDQRAGGGVTWHPNDDIWIGANALFARHEEVVPSRYETDMTYRVLDSPGTYLRAGAIYYHASETSAWSRYLGIRQSLSRFWHLEYRRIWSDTLSPSREHAHVDDINIRYEKEEDRIVTLGLTRGNEVFSEAASTFGAASGSYAMRSVYASWKEWVRKDWGVIMSASQTARANDNDSRAVSVGVFFEF